MTRLVVFSPSGVSVKAAPVRLAVKRLRTLGFDAALDADALKRFQRFGGDDDTRLGALHRIAREAPSIAMAVRGGYGLTRLLDRIDWPLLARSVEADGVNDALVERCTSYAVTPTSSEAEAHARATLAPPTEAVSPVTCDGAVVSGGGLTTAATAADGGLLLPAASRATIR